MLPGIFSAFITFAAFVIAVVVRFNRPPVGHRLKAMIRIWAMLLALYAGLYWVSGGKVAGTLESVVFLINGVLIYGLLFCTFCYCYFVSDHSLSMLFMLAMQDRLSLDEIKRQFPYDELLRQRMIDLENNHFAVRRGESFELTPKGRSRARVAGTLKRFLNLEPGG
ncbi:MAG: hypothetical protein WCS70_06160 [Verrucomicrobiota bacterium]